MRKNIDNPTDTGNEVKWNLCIAEGEFGSSVEGSLFKWINAMASNGDKPRIIIIPNNVGLSEVNASFNSSVESLRPWMKNIVRTEIKENFVWASQEPKEGNARP